MEKWALTKFFRIARGRVTSGDPEAQELLTIGGFD